MKMEKARQLLDAAQEKQMVLIEKDSTHLNDHAEYWKCVRQEMTLLYAARTKGLQLLGGFPVPALQVSECKAKQAIELQLLCGELMQTEWAKDPWTAADISWERWCSAPARCLKKGPQLCEVMYDGNPENVNLYTVWTWVGMRSSDGWSSATGGADASGIYYQTMAGKRTYYETFDTDARRYSVRGRWEVRFNGHSYQSHPSSPSRDQVDGTWEPSTHSRGGEEAVPAEPPPSRTDRASSGPCRGSSFGIRFGARPHPYHVPVCSRESQLRATSTPLPCQVSQILERGEEVQEEPQSPDSTEIEDITPCDPGVESGFSLFKPGGHCCLLLQGSANQVKCHRFRVKKKHRSLYQNVTTTWQAVADEGSSRQGQSCLFYTFESHTQRTLFLKTVPMPNGMSVQKLRVMLD
ncbi:E2 protein [Okapia johnstoni papillomavirus 1]|uniref:Regulatory protein E2 n=1 Tax=Okapia johnstoni papillomavirus 1 TaxID=2304449 RepID=A0A346LUY4_9PAPI|nr:E2 protein [Okapia johnstoni papillomavirus 1]